MKKGEAFSYNLGLVAQGSVSPFVHRSAYPEGLSDAKFPLSFSAQARRLPARDPGSFLWWEWAFSFSSVGSFLVLVVAFLFLLRGPPELVSLLHGSSFRGCT